MLPRILVVDDEPAIREFVGLALTAEGYDVNIAEHGTAALDIISPQPPHLILLDLKMPTMDGLDFLKKYCEQENPAPVVIFTASKLTPEPTLCVREVLTKPFDLDMLLATVEKYVSPEAPQ
jgi:DNA-binding response OmpR family regulator